MHLVEFLWREWLQAMNGFDDNSFKMEEEKFVQCKIIYPHRLLLTVRVIGCVLSS